MDMKQSITLTVNGRNIEFEAAPRKLLSDALREDCHLTGTHVGCEHGVCGACTVLIDGAPARSCITFAVAANRAEVTTLEGFEGDPVMDTLREAFADTHGLQCGFCTPGMLMTARALLDRDPDPSEETIREAISGQICRCTGYTTIVRSVRWAAEHEKAAQEAAGSTS